MNQDFEHLKLLSIFHYVVAGLVALFACFPLIHFFVGLGIVTGAFEDAPGEAQLIGVFFMVFAGLFIMTGWAMLINLSNFYSGSKWLLFSIGLCTFILEIWMIIESLVVLSNVYGKEIEATPEAV